VDWADKIVTLLSSLSGVVVGAYLTRQANQRTYERQTERAAREARLTGQHEALGDYVALVASRSIAPSIGEIRSDAEEIERRREEARTIANIARAFDSLSFAQRAGEAVRVLQESTRDRYEAALYVRAAEYCGVFERQMRDAIHAFESELKLPALPILPKPPERPEWVKCPENS
jgi:hypothetical protein